MPTPNLPDDANLSYLRARARELKRRVRSGDEHARGLVARHLTGGAALDRFPLSAAQLVVARECGFASWPRLKQYFDVARDHRWDGATAVGPGDDPADAFCRLGCLTYADDGPQRWAAARAVRADHPELTSEHVWAAAAAADVDSVRRLVGADPGLARRPGGPNRWRPLCYLAYSRVYPDVESDAILDIARVLLSAGADPNEGYLWRGLPTPFTLLTGAFGSGEQGDQRTPPHPHGAVLATLLLQSGADPNDGQTLYNRMFHPADDHLRLLFEFGLGTGGGGGPWKARLGGALQSPTEMLRSQLLWAVDHGFTDRARLLAEYGVDVRAPFPDGRTPAEHAARNGDQATVGYLLSRGAAPPGEDPVTAVIGAALAGDRAFLAHADPAVISHARQERPGLITWAAATGRRQAIPLLAEIGFDVNARARGDAPIEQPWETGLHHAAADGDVELAQVLLSLGADPTIRDARFNATPLGWAHHFGQPHLVELLEPLSSG